MSLPFDPYIFQKSDQSWWWYDRNAGLSNSKNGPVVPTSFPTYGPFLIEAQAEKDARFFFAAKKSRSHTGSSGRGLT